MYDDYEVISTLKGVLVQDSTLAKRPSLNWHLTYSEKQSLMRNIKSQNNSKTIDAYVEAIMD